MAIDGTATGRWSWILLALLLTAPAMPAARAADAAASAPTLTDKVKWSNSLDGELHYYTPDRDIPVADWHAAVALLPTVPRSSPTWSIFDHPRDSPDSFVVRETLAGPYWVVISPASLHAPTLEAARAMLPPGVVPVAKSQDDPKNMVEVWGGP